MVVSSQRLCAIYGVLAVLALLATWHQNAAYLGGDPVSSTVQFWRETLVTPASVSIMVDLFLLGLAVVVWMVAEARRLGVPYVWVYVAMGALVAISVSVPLFLIARERRQRVLRPAGEAVVLSSGDVVGFALFSLPTLMLTGWSFFH